MRKSQIAFLLAAAAVKGGRYLASVRVKGTACCAAASIALAVVIASPASRADNPIVQTLYTADPAPMVHDGRIYLYTTHDEDVTVNDFFTMNDWRVYSSTDVVNWTDHGSPLHYRDFSWASGNAWAGQVIHRNGTFYFYVPVVRSNGSNAIGVATSDNPWGPFEDAIGSPLITSDCGDIDPSVFIDDDDQAYLYWGNPNLCYVSLNEDMVSYQGSVVRVTMNTASFGVRSENDRPTSYEEGPWFYKREGRYYLAYPGGPLPEHIAYSTSTGATGPWTYGGVIMPAEGGSFTNHPGVIDYKGKSFFFYHNGALPGGGGFKRSVCVEEFSYDGDGGFPQLRMTTEGASAVDVLNPYLRTEAETIAWGSGVETEPCDEGGMNVTSIENGDYIKVKEVDFGTGALAFQARVASATNGGSIELRLDGQNGMQIGTCLVEGTNGSQSWENVSCNVSGATGIHDLFLSFAGGSGALFNFNWWQFTAIDGGSGGAGGGGGMAAAGTGAAGAGQAGMLGGGAGGSAGGAGVSGSLNAGGIAGEGAGGRGAAAGSGGIAAGQAGTSLAGGGGTAAGRAGAGSAAGGAAAGGGATSRGGSSSGAVGGGAGAASESGCGCRTVPHRSNGSSLLFVGLAFAFLRRRTMQGARPRPPQDKTSPAAERASISRRRGCSRSASFAGRRWCRQDCPATRRRRPRSR
jgi:hypothetical protein